MAPLARILADISTKRDKDDALRDYVETEVPTQHSSQLDICSVSTFHLHIELVDARLRKLICVEQAVMPIIQPVVKVLQWMRLVCFFDLPDRKETQCPGIPAGT